MAAFAYNDDEWRAVTETIPAPHDLTLLGRVRDQLETKIATPYLEGVQAAQNSETQKPLEVKRKVPKVMRKVQFTLDYLPPGIMADYRNHTRSLIEAMDDANRRNRGKSRADRQRVLLHQAMLRVWTDMLGQRLGIGRPDKATSRSAAPTSPTIRFLDAVLRPVLQDQTPRPSGLASIIERDKSARADDAAKMKTSRLAANGKQPK